MLFCVSDHTCAIQAVPPELRALNGDGFASVYAAEAQSVDSLQITPMLQGS